VHPDQKPAKVLLDGALLPRIADFGLARLVTPECQMEMTESVGTPVYMAPELAGTAYTAKVDVYAFGVLLFEIAAARRAFEKHRHLGACAFLAFLALVADGLRPTVPDGVPPRAAALIRACWDPDPDRRPAFADMLRDPHQFLLEGADAAAFRTFTRNLLENGKMELEE
jgi:serine/threonine protein kinase